MIIRKIKMVNFRWFSEKQIDFYGKPVVLFSAANGIGKTTTIDAIEWCLTGNIGRLKASFSSRSTNNDERKINVAGILKNRRAKEDDKVRVELSLFDGEKEMILCREQTEDTLDPKEFTLTLNGSTEDASAFLKEYINSSFYNYHFCDVQKSFHVQSTKRDKLKELFSEFITNYDVQTQMAKNLEVFAEDVDRYIEDLEKKKESPEKIEDLENRIVEARKSAKQVPYPETCFYPDERADLASLNQDALLAQKEAVRNCGYLAAQEVLDKLVRNAVVKKQLGELKEIVSCWETMGESIRRAMNLHFPNHTDAITAREKKLEALKHMTLVKDTILQDSVSVIALGNAGFTQSDFDADLKQIQEKEHRVNTLSSEIDLLTKNNKMLKLLSSLTSKKQVVIQYRDNMLAENGSVRCPICGSETFASMSTDEILWEANEYIGLNGKTATVKTTEKTSLQDEIEALYQKIICRAELVVMTERDKLEEQIRELNNLQNEVKPYFDAVVRLQKTSLQIRAEELSAEKAAQLLAAAENMILSDSEEQHAIVTYRQILTVLGYQLESETVQQTHAKVANLITRSYAVSNFSYDMLVSKLNAIDSILANQSLLEGIEKLEAYRHKNRAIDSEIAKLRDLYDIARSRADEITAIVAELSKDEYKKVGPALEKYYNKLARFNAVDEIHIELKNEGISLVDKRKKNIVNILSNGQISVFMLALFFAGIDARKGREKMKIYFIDDLTACMDDVNMLAFMDLLKYQVTSRSTMDQLFFTTCDDRISNLLKYKLTGRGIELCELGETELRERPVGL